MLRAPNVALFVVSGCLAMIGVLSALPISLPIPGLAGASAWYIFDAWFLLALGSVLPQQSALEENTGAFDLVNNRAQSFVEPMSRFP